MPRRQESYDFTPWGAKSPAAHRATDPEDFSCLSPQVVVIPTCDSPALCYMDAAMSAVQSELAELGSQHLYPNYRQAPLAIVRGEGALLWDAAGKRYIDMLAGIAVSSLGHAHPKLVAAIADQAARVLHVSNYYYNEPNVRLAAKLCALSGMDRAFFCNSGTEAIEASLKLVRRHFTRRVSRSGSRSSPSRTRFTAAPSARSPRPAKTNTKTASVRSRARSTYHTAISQPCAARSVRKWPR